MNQIENYRFSPRNGESVLKEWAKISENEYDWFQSPQWGKCSKGNEENVTVQELWCFSPRNGESVLKIAADVIGMGCTFQSPQWGKCSKGC